MGEPKPSQLIERLAVEVSAAFLREFAKLLANGGKTGTGANHG